jgi:hypothetical protein
MHLLEGKKNTKPALQQPAYSEEDLQGAKASQRHLGPHKTVACKKQLGKMGKVFLLRHPYRSEKIEQPNLAKNEPPSRAVEAARTTLAKIPEKGPVGEKD